MHKKKEECIRLDPEERLCPAYDSTGLKLFPAGDPDTTGFVVTDNFPEEHIQ